MTRKSEEGNIVLVLAVGFLAWFVPGGGHFLLKQNKRAMIIFITIVLTFCVGLYIGSIGVINPIGAKPWYVAQIMNTPIVVLLGHATATGAYPVYGRPNEIGQIYTSVAGLLILLCIVNAVYVAYVQGISQDRR